MKINLRFLNQNFTCEIKKAGEEYFVETPFGRISLIGYFKEGIFYLKEREKEIPLFYFLEKDNLYLEYNGKVWEFQRKEKKFKESEGTQKFDGKIYPPMPGNIVKILVSEGEEIEKGQALLIMESMKMEHTLYSPVKGKIGKIYALPQTVAELSKPLLEIKEL